MERDLTGCNLSDSVSLVIRIEIYWRFIRGTSGEYLVLLGARLDGAEMYASGLATHYVPLEVRNAHDQRRKRFYFPPSFWNNRHVHRIGRFQFGLWTEDDLESRAQISFGFYGP